MSTTNPLPDFVDSIEELHEFSGVVQDCLAHRETITQVLGALYTRYIAEEDIQQELNRMFAEYEFVKHLVDFEYNQEGVVQYAEAAQEFDLLSETEKEEIEDLWAKIEWIVDGYRAAMLAEQGYKYWTEVDVEVDVENSQQHDIIVRHDLTWGADQSFNVILPLGLHIDQIQDLITKWDNELQRAESRSVGAILDEGTFVLTRNNLRKLIEICHDLDDTLANIAIKHDSEITNDDLFETTPVDILVEQVVDGDLELEHLYIDDTTKEAITHQASKEDVRKALTDCERRSGGTSND